MEYGGAIYQPSLSQHNKERWFNLRKSRSSSSSPSGLCTRQMFDLDRFSILPVSWCQLADRAIGLILYYQGGLSSEQVDHTLGIIFLGSRLAFLYLSFRACGYLLDKLKLIEKQISYSSIMFSMLEFFPVLYLWRFRTFKSLGTSKSLAPYSCLF